MKSKPNRSFQFESLEPRLVMSAQALSNFVADLQAPVDAAGLDLDQRIEMLTQSDGTENFQNDVAAIREQYNLSGNGQTVAVIDSGIAFDHLALGGGFGEDYRVVGGYDFAEDDANPYDDGPVGLHGTHVSGIIGASSDEFDGVAPGVDLVSLRVFDDNGAGQLAWVEQALQWVHENRNAFENPITTVNLSVGTQWNSNVIPEAAQLEDEFALLKDAGIFVSVAAGNLFQDFNEVGVSYPAASPFVVPVASHASDGQISDFSQRNDRVLVAPGESILSTVPDHVFFGSETDGFLRTSGTSQAAPYVAGASALLREAFQEVGHTQIDQDLLYDHFLSTADVIHDQVTGGSYHRINLAQAIEAAFESVPNENVASENDTTPPDTELNTEPNTEPAYVDNGQLIVRGTNADDQIELDFTSSIDVSFNGQEFSFDRSEIAEVLVIGSSGSDSIVATLDNFDRTVVRNGRVDAFADSIEFTARGFESIDVVAGFNSGRLVINDSAGADTVSAGFDSIAISGDQYQNTATGFSRVTVNSSNGGYDRIELQGTTGDDRFSSDGDRNVLRHGEQRIVAVGFENSVVYGRGGEDFATLRDSAGNDQFVLNGKRFSATAPDFLTVGYGFERTNTISRTGFDTVSFEGGEEAERLLHRNGKTRFSDGDYLNIASGFDQIEVNAFGPDDVARIHDSIGNDSFISSETGFEFHGGNQSLYANGFSEIDVFADSGGIDSATLIGSNGNDQVFANNSTTILTNADGQQVQLTEFENVTVDTLGGLDLANLIGSEGRDLLATLENGIELESSIRRLEVLGSEDIQFDGRGGVDEVIFSDFDSLDLIEGLGDSATAYLNSRTIEATNFEFLEARTRDSEVSNYDIAAVDYLFLLDGDWQQTSD